jgi:heptosyltransferase I
VALRRWRREFTGPGTWRELAATDRRLRTTSYDEVIDTQGLLKSALIAARSRGRKHGYDSASIREPMASFFYDVKHAVSRDLHAVERNRILTGLSLDYRVEGALDYGLDRVALKPVSAERYAILLHATARAEKQWPVQSWIDLGKRLQGTTLILPWGSESERQRAAEIASTLPNARLTDKLPIDAVTKQIAGAQFVVGVDTGLLHLAAALQVPLVGIFVGSEPKLTGPVGAGAIQIVGAKGSVPSVADVAHALSRVTG